MTITLNGDERSFDADMSVSELLAALDAHPKTVAVERNGEIVRRPNYDDVQVVDGDVLEVVRFFPGG